MTTSHTWGLALATLLLAGPIQARPEPPPQLPAFVDVPLVTYYYDPALGGINCDPGGGCQTFGSGQVIQDYHYNASAACPVAWRGQLLEIDHFGAFWCLDSGGAIGVHYDREHGLHVKIDILSRQPVALGPWSEWQLITAGEVNTQ